MTAQTWTLSSAGGFTDLLHDANLRSVRAYVVSSEEVVTDTTTGGATRLGSKLINAAIDEPWSVAGLPATGDPNWMPAIAAYKLVVEYLDDAPDTGVQRWESNYFTLTADVDFKDVVAVTPTAVTPAMVANFNAAIAAITGKAAQMTLRAVTTSTTAADAEFIEVDATSAVRTVTGPAAGAATRWGVKKVNGTSTAPGNKVTISYLNSAGATTTLDLTLAGESKVFRPSGLGYRVESGDTPKAGLDYAYSLTGGNALALGTAAGQPATLTAVGPASGGDDTATMQAALNAMTAGSVLQLTAGQTYRVTNLVIPDVAYLTILLNGSTIRYFGTGGDASYLIATYNWVNNVTNPGAQMCRIIGPGSIIGSSTSTANEKVNGIVCMASRFWVVGLEVSYCSGAAIRMDAQTKNGTDVAANVVENRFLDLRLHESGYGFYSNDSQTSGVYRNTDGYLTDCIAFNCTSSNLYFDKWSGWTLTGLHTYQTGTGMGTAFTAGTNYDLYVADVGVGGTLHNSIFESGCLWLKGFTQTHSARLSKLFFGFSAPSGALVKIDGVSDTAVSLDGCVWHGPTSANTYCSLFLTGPTANNPFRVYINGGHMGFRNPISWAQRVKVFTSNLAIMQIGFKLPPDLVCTGLVPTSGARPPGTVYRTVSPSAQDFAGNTNPPGPLTTETYVVGDRWVNTAPSVLGAAGSQYTVEGGVCVTAGTPGTWADRRVLTGT